MINQNGSTPEFESENVNPTNSDSNLVPSPEQASTPEAEAEKATDTNDANESSSASENEELTINEAPQEVAHSEDFHPNEAEDHEEISTHLDISNLSFEELVEKFESLALETSISAVKAEIQQVRQAIEQQMEFDKKKQQDEFVASEVEETFTFIPSEIQKRFLDALNNLVFRETREKEELDKERQDNQKIKEGLLSRIRTLVESEESQKNFTELRELQTKWRETGPVPAAQAKEINQSYKALLDQFYDKVKIHRELMELDFQHNLKTKMDLCERAEELLIEESVNKSIDSLNHLHDLWKATGPVPREKRAEVWERFKLASDKIYEKRRSFFSELGELKKQNYALKAELVEKVKGIDYSTANSHQDWQKLSEQISAVQSEWKKIGFAPKALNEEIWDAFKKACDDFYNAKNVFYKKIRQDQNHNLNLKNELCIKAEALMDSTDWKKTTDELIRLQKEWKSVGAIPRKNSEKLWQRFRNACDAFFNRKNEFFSGKDAQQSENLTAKTALIEEIEGFTLSDDPRTDIEKLKDFQRRWMEIGFIPLKEKETIYNRYREAINGHFDALKLNASEKAKLNYQSKINNLKQGKDGFSALKKEQNNLMNRINGLKNDILLWQNNIEFLSASKNADVLRKEVEQKIERAQQELKELDAKLKILRQN